MNLLEQLSTMTVVVADTGDLRSIEKARPRDATTNPSLITAAAQMPEYRDVVDGALRWASNEAGKDAATRAVVDLAIDRLSVELGLRILGIVPGRVSTEVDARLSYDTDATVTKARQLIAQYEQAGATRDRVLIKVAATWEGIRAAEVLEEEGIHCNLTLMFGMHQAVACAEARVTLISPFVGRILDWHRKETGRDHFPMDEDPGVQSVTRIYDYYKRHDHGTEVMGASFRNTEQIVGLAGCDLLTISPQLLDRLAAVEGTLERRLDPQTSRKKDIPKITVDRPTYDRMHAEDRMSREKLAEGIEGFTKAIVALEQLLAERLVALTEREHVGGAARRVFSIYDLDGDGLITREEWGGTDDVFRALDRDGDGAITPEEMAAGLGGAFLLPGSGSGAAKAVSRRTRR